MGQKPLHEFLNHAISSWKDQSFLRKAINQLIVFLIDMLTVKRSETMYQISNSIMPVLKVEYFQSKSNFPMWGWCFGECNDHQN